MKTQICMCFRLLFPTGLANTILNCRVSKFCDGFRKRTLKDQMRFRLKSEANHADLQVQYIFEQVFWRIKVSTNLRIVLLSAKTLHM